MIVYCKQHLTFYFYNYYLKKKKALVLRFERFLFDFKTWTNSLLVSKSGRRKGALSATEL